MWCPRYFSAPALFFWLYSHAYAAAPCDEFTARLPNVKRSLCESANLQPSAAKSVNGRTLWMRDIKADYATLRVLVIGAKNSLN